MTLLLMAAVMLEDLNTHKLVPLDLETGSVIVSFIRPGCMPCKAQLKAMECVKDKYGKGVRTFAVQSQGYPEELYRDLKPMHLKFPVLKGSADFLAKYGASESPTPLNVLFRQGKAPQQILGAQSCEFWAAKLREAP